jgi:hypothetical protein
MQQNANISAALHSSQWHEFKESSLHLLKRPSKIRYNFTNALDPSKTSLESTFVVLVYDPAALITILQRTYAYRVLHKFNMHNCNPAKTPFENSVQLHKPPTSLPNTSLLQNTSKPPVFSISFLTIPIPEHHLDSDTFLAFTRDLFHISGSILALFWL